MFVEMAFAFGEGALVMVDDVGTVGGLPDLLPIGHVDGTLDVDGRRRNGSECDEASEESIVGEREAEGTGSSPFV